MSINQVMLVGNLTNDPEKKKAGDTAIIEFGIACNEYRKGEERPNFFECVMYGDRAKSLAPILCKGMKVGIIGKLVQDRWQNKDGENRSKVRITVFDVELMTTKQDNAKDGIPW